jgi:ribosomal protein L7/L12
MAHLRQVHYILNFGEPPILSGVIQAKKFVESVPKVLKENVPKEDADKLQKTLEALGATVTLS